MEVATLESQNGFGVVLSMRQVRTLLSAAAIFFPLLPTPFPFPSSVLAVRFSMHMGMGGKRKGRSHLYQLCPEKFPHQGNSELGRSHSFSAPLNDSVIAQKSQTQSYFKCSLPFINLTICHSVKLLEFLHFRCFQFRDLRRKSGFPTCSGKAAFLSSPVWAYEKKLGKT